MEKKREMEARQGTKTLSMGRATRVWNKSYSVDAVLWLLWRHKEERKEKGKQKDEEINYLI